MMESPAVASRRPLLCLLLLVALCLRPGLGLYTVNAVYGDTIVMPCPQEVPSELMFGKWKFETANDSPVFIAFRSSTKKSVQYDDVPEYKDRLSLSENYTLSIKNARISDEKRFVCMLVTEDNVFEEPTVVKVFKQPSQPEIIHPANFLETGKLKMLGECIARESYPEGNITWYKNGNILQPIEGVVVMSLQKTVDKSNGLFTTTSSLQYMPTKKDANAQFACSVTYYGPSPSSTVGKGEREEQTPDREELWYLFVGRANVSIPGLGMDTDSGSQVSSARLPVSCQLQTRWSLRNHLSMVGRVGLALQHPNLSKASALFSKPPGLFSIWANRTVCKMAAPAGVIRTNFQHGRLSWGH